MANSLEQLAWESIERTGEQRRGPPVRSSEWLDRAIAWVEYSAHKPWCNVAPGNIYASDGEPCDCGRDTVLKDLNAARSNTLPGALCWHSQGVCVGSMPTLTPWESKLDELKSSITQDTKRLLRGNLSFLAGTTL